MLFELTNTSAAAPLFDGWEETLIWSCLQGVMGKIYADDAEHPASAIAVNGDFTFFAGKADISLVSCQSKQCTKQFMILVPQTEYWQEAILQYYDENAQLVSRYAIKKEPDIFDTDKLEKIAASLPTACKLSMIDQTLYETCRSQAWSADLVSQFPDPESFCTLGLGVVVCKNGVVVSGASSYSRYDGGIEIEIDTRPDCRRQGLALVCGAKLILECLKKNLYPSWDAQNKASVALAEKLGYHYSHTYPAIEIRR